MITCRQLIYALTASFVLNAGVFSLLPAHSENGGAQISTTKPIPFDAVNAIENDQYKEAVAKLQAYLKTEPGSAEGHYLLGKAFLSERNYKPAKVELRNALRLGHGDEFAAKANDMLRQMPKSFLAPKRFQPVSSKGEKTNSGHTGMARPHVLTFSTKWVQSGTQLQSDLDAAKARYPDKLEFYTLDVDDPKNEQIVNQYDISLIPTVLVLDTHGKAVSAVVGYSDSKQLQDGLKKVLKEK